VVLGVWHIYACQEHKAQINDDVIHGERVLLFIRSRHTKKLAGPTIINKDNNAAIAMVDSNNVEFWRNNHWIVRRFYIREEVAKKDC
jgi:hypothetical protein